MVVTKAPGCLSDRGERTKIHQSVRERKNASEKETERERQIREREIKQHGEQRARKYNREITSESSEVYNNKGGDMLAIS